MEPDFQTQVHQSFLSDHEISKASQTRGGLLLLLFMIWGQKVIRWENLT